MVTGSQLVTVTCTKCGQPMRLPEGVAKLPCDERLCGKCTRRRLRAMVARMEGRDEDGLGDVQVEQHSLWRLP